MKVAIFGGTFNPVHIGHLIMAQYVKNFAEIDKVIFVPNGIPPHKNADIAPPEDRFEMVKLSIDDNPDFEISDFEIKNKEKSFTINTLNYFSLYYEKVYFILGSDNLFEIKNWYKAEEILKKFPIIVLPRERDTTLIETQIQEFKIKFAAKMILINMPVIDISSTEIRRLVKEGKSIRYMVHPKVEEYIFRKGLYKK